MRTVLILFFVMIVPVVSIIYISYSFGISQNYVILDKWGSKGSGDGEFNIPHSIAFDSFGNFYVTDTYNNRIQKFSSDGKFITKWGSKGSGNGAFLLPLGIDLNSESNVFVIDREASNIQEFSNDGKFIPPRLMLETKGKENFTVLEDIEIDNANTIYLTDRGNHQIKKYGILE